MKLQYHIADTKIILDSNFELADSPSWRRFSDNSETVDFTFFCYRSPLLPQLPESKNLHSYFDSVKGRTYALTRHFEDHTDIYLAEENLPWGQTVDQLFTQLAMTHVLLKKSKLLLHAAYILTEKGAILFTAPSGTGKSTQAELWQKYRGAKIINGDRAVVGFHGEIPMAYGFPLSGSSAICVNQTAPLRAIVRLHQGEENSIRLLRGAEAVSVLLNGTAIPEEYKEDLPKIMDTAILLAQNIPILDFSCLPDESAIFVLEQTLKSFENGGLK